MQSDRSIEGEPAQFLQEYAVADTAEEREKFVESLRRLETSGAGQPAAEAIREHDTVIRFGPTERGAIAQFDPETNEITIHEDLKSASHSQ